MEHFKYRSNEQEFTAQQEAKTADQKFELNETLKQERLLQDKRAAIMERLKSRQADFKESSARAKEIKESNSSDLADPQSPLSIELQQAREDAASYEAQINEARKELENLSPLIGAVEDSEQELRIEIDNIEGGERNKE